MVQTRHQWETWRDRNWRNTQSSQGSSQHSCRSCSQESMGSQRSDHNFDYSPPTTQDTPNEDRNMYGPNDHCKRHRKPDNEEKNMPVTSYRRREPRR